MKASKTSKLTKQQNLLEISVVTDFSVRPCDKKQFPIHFNWYRANTWPRCIKMQAKSIILMFWLKIFKNNFFSQRSSWTGTCSLDCGAPSAVCCLVTKTAELHPSLSLLVHSWPDVQSQNSHNLSARQVAISIFLLEVIQCDITVL